ncbi:diacylglycerol kinase family lipid kinase [candidate division KSB1 bacterium]|nr:diacylglycerol kinase family lipid kinase [candidate division KSB1 bacterium]
MKPVKIILNPVAGRGFSRKSEPRIRQLLKDEGVEFELVQTEYRWHAAELAEQAVMEGYELIVAAGGDGTTNEVVNGLMIASENGKEAVMGFIPTGTGSDFMSNVGIPPDLKGACQRVAHGTERLVDIGQLSMPGQKPRYFDNQLGVGFDGIVTMEATKFKHLRGIALYLPVVLKSVFLASKAPVATIEYDDQKLTQPSMQISIVNGAREGGAFYMAPEAKIDDGWLDLCMANGATDKRTLFGLIPKFMKGTHVDHRIITMARAKKVTITSEENLIAHFDGELLCTEGHRIECEIIPNRLKVRC